jgi:hypothetical protein
MDVPEDPLVTRHHMLRMLPIMRLPAAQERRLLALDYPVPYSVVAPVFDSVGIDVDTLIDRMGGSP